MLSRLHADSSDKLWTVSSSARTRQIFRRFKAGQSGYTDVILTVYMRNSCSSESSRIKIFHNTDAVEKASVVCGVWVNSSWAWVQKHRNAGRINDGTDVSPNAIVSIYTSACNCLRECKGHG